MESDESFGEESRYCPEGSTSDNSRVDRHQVPPLCEYRYTRSRGSSCRGDGRLRLSAMKLYEGASCSREIPYTRVPFPLNRVGR